MTTKDKHLTRAERLDRDHAEWQKRMTEWERAKASAGPLSAAADKARSKAFTAHKAAQQAFNAKLANPGDRQLAADYEKARAVKEATAVELAKARAEFEAACDLVQAGASLASQEPPLCGGCRTRMDRDAWLSGNILHPSCH